MTGVYAKSSAHTCNSQQVHQQRQPSSSLIICLWKAHCVESDVLATAQAIRMSLLLALCSCRRNLPAAHEPTHFLNWLQTRLFAATVPAALLPLPFPAVLSPQSLTFKFTVAGRGGHAAMPHLNIDPVPAAAALVQALQVLVSRETSPLGSAVLSITQLMVRLLCDRAIKAVSRINQSSQNRTSVNPMFGVCCALSACVVMAADRPTCYRVMSKVAHV